MNEDLSVIANESTLDLVAGRHPNGELIIEKVLVNPLEEEHKFQLLKSPVFIRGIARGDAIYSKRSSQGQFNVIQRGGNLCIRVFSKSEFDSPQLESLEPQLTSAIEKLGGDLDIKEPKALVYSIHVSCGFSTIEKEIVDVLSVYQDVVWYYGNVYDPQSGEPLDWWQALLAPE